MARRRTSCRVGGRGCGAFLRYLEGTLIPDTVETGREGTATDLRAVVKFIRGASSVRIHGRSYSRAAFRSYLEDTLIPDLYESGSESYARDFEEALRFF